MPSLIKLNKSTKKCNLSDFSKINNKILILRKCGGYGDIINMRMIFQDLKLACPDFDFYWALPHGYFPAAAKHPYVKDLVNFSDFKESDYLAVYNLTHCCTKYEWSLGIKCDKNRSDIWAEYMGLDLNNHNCFMPDYSNLFPSIKERLISLGWDGIKKLVAFAPKSALSVKNLTFDQCKFIQTITKEFFLFTIHNVPILDLYSLDIPFLTNLSLSESMSAIQFSDFVIASDTGHLHCAGGYKKPSVGIFCYTNSENICRYYETVHVVQGRYRNVDDFCGPCNNFGNCVIDQNESKKPCLTNITTDMIGNAWKKALNNNK